MPNLTPAERRALDGIDIVPMLAQTQAWSSINSGSRNLQGLAAMAATLADAFAPLPGEVAFATPRPVTVVTPEGQEREQDHGRHLVVTVRPEAPIQLLFTGHMDTVFAADHPFQQQKWLSDTVLNGPGVADMKGGIAVMLAALHALERSEARDRIGYQVMINSDEEVGSLSSAELIRHLAAGKRAAFTYEPALPDGTLAGARAGSGNFSVTFTGRSAHAGRNPEEGRNALVAAADMALRLKALVRPGLKVNPAKIDGGGPNNVVPDHAVLRVNFRPQTPEDEADAALAIERLCGEVALAHDLRVHLHGGFGRPPKPLDPRAEALFGHVKACGEDLGLTIGWKSTGGVCDGNNIAACGVPVVDTMGVRGGSIHSADEFLIVESLPERAALSALAIIRMGAEAIGEGQ